MTTICRFPEKLDHEGTTVKLEPLGLKHAKDLWEASSAAELSFTYLKYGPSPSLDAIEAHVEELAARAHQPFWAVIDRDSDKAMGWLSLCDIYPSDAAIEVGSIWFSPVLQRTRASTEAIFLLMTYGFDKLNYQRFVWRCCSPNVASRNAAIRIGFRPEGTWRRAAIVRGVPMDIDWFSMMSEEWPERRAAILEWLDDSNFNEKNIAKRSLQRTVYR